MRVWAPELAARRIIINAVCPGWVRTDMGGRGASRSVEKGAASIVWTAPLAEEASTGSKLLPRRPPHRVVTARRGAGGDAGQRADGARMPRGTARRSIISNSRSRTRPSAPRGRRPGE